MMACYESCADNGKPWTVCSDKLYCFECGRIKPHYNFVPEVCGQNSQSESNSSEKTVKQRAKDRCQCTQSCWQWILSFLGLGAKLPDCCKGTPVTSWDSGEVARLSLTTKVKDVVHRIRGIDKAFVKRSSQINLPGDLQNVKKKRIIVENSHDEDAGNLSEAESDNSSEQGLKKIDFLAKTEATPKSTRRNSKQKHKSASQRTSGSTTHSTGRQSRKHSERLKGLTFESIYSQIEKKLANTPSECDDTSIIDRPQSIIFNPFENRIRTCNCPPSGSLRSIYCPKLPCPPCGKNKHKTGDNQTKDAHILEKDSLHLNQKEQPSTKVPEPSNKNCQASNTGPQSSYKSPPPLNKIFESYCTRQRPLGIRKSNSMPCTSCFSSKPYPSGFCRCNPVLPCGTPKLPCRSESFHSTLLRSPSPLAVVLPTTSPCCRPCVVSTGRPRCRRFKCSCTKICCERKSRSCSRSCCCHIKSPYCNPCKSQSPHKVGPCIEKKSPCCIDHCHVGNKPPVSLCQPCCTKPCCLPCPRQFTVFPYCPRLDPTSKRYLSIPPCSMRTACPCPATGPCSCPKPKHYQPPCCSYSPAPLCKTACTSSTGMSYIKAKQNDATCQRLLSKYGFSPPSSNLCCPPTCYGNASEGLCPSSICSFDMYNCYNTGGCKSCHPSLYKTNHLTCEHTEKVEHQNSQQSHQSSLPRKSISPD